jgi:hypothetical protein
MLASCSILPSNIEMTPRVVVSMDGQDRIRFSGKGAGAGMMLMSSMGATGIAIGIAIDEGISKEIHEAFSEKRIFSQLIQEETTRWMNAYCHLEAAVSLVCDNENVFNVTVHHYGFVTSSGENDPVIPKLDISFTVSDKNHDHLSISGDADSSPLELVKQDGEVSKTLLLNGYHNILKQLEQAIQ